MIAGVRCGVCVALTLASFSYALAKFPLPQEEGTPFSKSLDPTQPNPFLHMQMNFDDSMDAAQMQFGLGNLDGAIDRCDDALKWSHGRHASRALTLRGDAYLRKGEFVHALQDFTEASREDRGNTQANIMMMLMLMELEGI